MSEEAVSNDDGTLLDLATPVEVEKVEEVQQEAEPEEKEEAKPDSKTYSQEEVDRIVKKAKRNASYLARKEAEAELYRAQAERQTQPQQVQEPKDEAPKREAFESYEDYLEARAEWRADQKVKAAVAEIRQQQQQAAQRSTTEQRLQTFQAQISKVREEVADFDEVMEASGDVPLSQAMRDAILESDVGALLTYHLAKNPAEAKRISTLSPVSQVRALGAIEASLTRKPEPQVSKAPSPIAPISGGKGGQVNPDKMSMEDYIAFRQKRGAKWAR